jgi:hypothetical protein
MFFSPSHHYVRLFQEKAGKVRFPVRQCVLTVFLQHSLFCDMLVVDHALPHQESDFAFVTKYHLCESFGIFNQAPTSRTALRQKDRKHRECVSRGRFLVRQPGEVPVISAEVSRTGHV